MFVTFNLFFDDTTGLSNTMFKKQGRNKSYGGAGNTEKLNNLSVTFNGTFFDDKLSLNLGYRQLETDYDGSDTEKAFVAGAEYLIDMPYNISFLPLVEGVYINNFDGMTSRNITYLTAFLPIIYENWHFVASNTTKLDRENNYKNYTSYLTQLSIGYKFDFGLVLDFARIWEREAKKADGFSIVSPREKWVRHNDSWAFMVSYMFRF